jgi:hypothetical protein
VEGTKKMQALYNRLMRRWTRANSRQDQRAFLLDLMPKDSVCAEVGVWKGNFSEQILRSVQPRRLHLIDPWVCASDAVYKEAMYAPEQGGNQKYMDEMHLSILSKFSAEIGSGCVVVHRQPSEDAVKQFPSSYFDWVYIDGNHLYEFVKRDLQEFGARVKVGGFLAGDDYRSDKWWKDDVIRAVDEMRAQRQLWETVLVDDKGQWVLRKLNENHPDA